MTEIAFRISLHLKVAAFFEVLSRKEIHANMGYKCDKNTHTEKKEKTAKFSHRPRKNVSAVNSSIFTGPSEDGFAQHL